MARPTKQGVDYFPLDIHLDDKFKFIEIKFRLEGFAILIKLFQKIYSYGYWCKWTDDEALLFADEIRADYELVKDVVNECISRSIFDVNIYEKYGVLTSKGIQKRYKEIVRRRKDVEVIEDYLLIDDTFGINDVINPSLNKRNDDKSTQSKVKESKVNKSKEDVAKNENDGVLKTSQASSFFANNFNNYSPYIHQEIEAWEEDLSEEIVIASMKIALEKNVKNFNFCKAILQEWLDAGLKTINDVRAYETNKRHQKKPSKNSPRIAPIPKVMQEDYQDDQQTLSPEEEEELDEMLKKLKNM